MKKTRKMPKVVMAASVAAMGMGLFGALQNEAHATGASAKCYHNVAQTSGLTNFAPIVRV